ncbi:hypothetical protein FLACOL7796_03780 [Flavobacterium collinsii]|uniref:Uncharacterized protein n=1 Tax=Flavobacterium collinsii TaxID=1114861 RepID=A0ABM8KMS0_9FLAO|nr:hypothetical protein FLACOL7796_03780 [Flavobacterium collinsii]
MAKKDVWYDLIYLGTSCDKKKLPIWQLFLFTSMSRPEIS